MAEAKKCDRCGVFYQDSDFKEYYEYDISKPGMFHPIVLDLCPDCKRALNEWYKNPLVVNVVTERFECPCQKTKWRWKK